MAESIKVTSQKILAIWVAYGIGIFLLLMGALYPTWGQQLWATSIGALIIILAHISWEAEGVKIVATKLSEGKKEGQ